MRQIVVALLLTGILAGSASCSSAHKTNKAAAGRTAVVNGDWELQDLPGTTIPMSQLYTGKRPFLHIDVAAGRASGNTGCNSFSGPVRVRSGHIRFSENMMMTKMYCQGEGETSFIQVLKKVDAYRSDSATLTLLSAELPVMQFNRKLDAGDK